MNGKEIFAFLALLLVGVAAAASINQYLQTATIPENTDLQLFIDEAPQAINSTIAWGTITAGQTYTKTLCINNTGNMNITISLIVDLPADWQQTWTANNTLIAPATNVTAPLYLLAPTNAAPGNYQWTTQILTD